MSTFTDSAGSSQTITDLESKSGTNDLLLEDSSILLLENGVALSLEDGSSSAQTITDLAGGTSTFTDLAG